MAGFLDLSPVSICELEILTPLFRVPRDPRGVKKWADEFLSKTFIKSWNKVEKHDDITSFSYSFYDFEFPQTNATTVFYGKICIKACLEIEKTHVVCCGHPQNNYFMFNSNKISHCVMGFINQFSKNYYHWLQQPSTERKPDISEKFEFLWSIPKKKSVLVILVPWMIQTSIII